jgi:hypothetical protein
MIPPFPEMIIAPLAGEAKKTEEDIRYNNQTNLVLLALVADDSFTPFPFSNVIRIED